MTAIPLPEPDMASAGFFAALDQGRLEVMRCERCGTAHLAALTCDLCGGSDVTAVPATGRGTIYSFTRVHTAHHPAFADHLPVCGGIVELAEGPRLFAPLLGGGPWMIGAPVRLQLLRVGDRAVAAFRLEQA